MNTPKLPENTISKEIAEKIHQAWNSAWAENDIDALLALYADDATIESPLIPYLLGKDQGVCRGKKEFRQLLEIAAHRKPTTRKYYISKYFINGNTLIWEYPRATPNGEQMDFIEVVELKNGLIYCHRVYWGWYGFNILKNDQYYS
jgi:hypothetical protein